MFCKIPSLHIKTQDYKWHQRNTSHYYTKSGRGWIFDTVSRKLDKHSWQIFRGKHASTPLKNHLKMAQLITVVDLITTKWFSWFTAPLPAPPSRPLLVPLTFIKISFHKVEASMNLSWWKGNKVRCFNLRTKQLYIYIIYSY